MTTLRWLRAWLRAELGYALYWRWTRFCHVHDKAHMPWRHRRCCARQYEHPAVRALIRHLTGRATP